ncbi:NarK/NasA family nitrate transporter [Cryptosporangium minutisporangium]|uniref:NarK/NasA family nitrate transporter n=2 Tax=Cryptosporangium minutisporangium TaxID=113569 RepID=A0ABP6SSY1_9ACTN
MLAVAVLGYVLASWAWALMAPLAPLLDDALGLTPMQQALAVSLPVVVGTLGRVPVGALTDRFGGRLVFVLVTGATIVALLVLATFGTRSVGGLLIGATLLGVAGTMLTVGVPFVSAWFPDAHRGLAIGAVGAGLCGNAIGGFTAVRLTQEYGMAAPYLVTAAALGVFALVAGAAARNAPAQTPRAGAARIRVAAVLRLPITRQATLWYTVSLALFATFSATLPLYLVNTYRLGAARAGDVLAVFVLVSVFTRPVGGWLADRLTPARPLAAAMIVLAVATAVQAFTPPLALTLAGTLPVLAVGLGIVNTTVIAQIAATVPPTMIGLVTGVTCAIAGIAGFLSPLLMAFSFTRYGDYGPALGALAAGSAFAAWIAVIQIRRAGRTP